MADRNDAPVDGLDDYLERFMSYPRAARTDVDAVMRRRRPLRSRFAAPAGVVLLTGALVAVLALALVHHQGAGGAAGENYQGQQLDIVLRTVTGSGDTTTAVGAFPYARYTFYTDEDPANCVTGVQLQNAAGKYVNGDRTPETPPPGVNPETMNFALVQTNVPAGNYKVHVSTWAQPCSWRVQEILNSMSSDQAPPPAEKAPQPPAFDATITSANPAQTIDIPVSGLYAIGLNFTPTLTTPSCPVTHGFLINSAGESEAVLGGQHAPKGSTPPPLANVGGGGLFLAAGERSVHVNTACSWQLEVKPALGPTGGGGQGFFAPPTPLPAPYTAAQVATMLLQGRQGGAPGACQDATTVGTKNSVIAPGGIVQMKSPYATWTEQSAISCSPSATPPTSAPAGTYVIDLDDCRAPKAETITLAVDAEQRVTVVRIVDSQYGQALAHHATCRDR